jgi:RNA polymerase sigma factor (sigma-70 family)
VRDKYRVVTLTEFDLDALGNSGPPLGEWYAVHAAALFRYIARRLGRELAEDLTAQVFVEALESWPRFDPSRGSAKTWLFAIATNLIRAHVRREQRLLDVYAQSGADPVTHDPMRAAEARLFAEDEWPRVAAALGDLSNVDRDILLLYCWAEFDYQNIADALGLPFGTVSSKMNRVRHKLRRRLGDDLTRGAGL